MKDFTLNKEKKGSYITDFYKASDGTYTIEFADGSEFTKVIPCEENLKKLEEIQQRQADEGVKNYSLLVKRKTKEGYMTLFSFFGTAGLCLAATFIPGIHEYVGSIGLGASATTIGLLSLLASYPAVRRYGDSFEAVCELDKIKYVEKHRDILYSFGEHPNALSGLSESLKSFILSEEDPFTLSNLYNYKLDDLKLIVANIAKEEKLGLTYKKVIKKSRNSK